MSLNITARRLRELACFLLKHDALWKERPFVDVPVSWEKVYPELSTACRSVTASQLPDAEERPMAYFQRFDELMPLLSTLQAFSQWPCLYDINSTTTEPRRPAGIDGRKWSQIVGVASALKGVVPKHVTNWVDWCAGKGHLGTALAVQTGQPVTALELNEQLVQRCADAADKHELVKFQQADVLKDSLDEYFTPKTGMVALHACGYLNSRLLALSVLHRPAFLAVVPCCYQRIEGMDFTPLSEAARSTELKFTRHQLRLPALDEVSVSEQKRAFRKREMAFRLGVDLLLREASGKNEYTPLGKIPSAVIRKDFSAFAGFIAERDHLSLPTVRDWSVAEAAGWERQHLASVLSLSRQLFRRAIESWLFLDRIAFLEEGGFNVTAAAFCPRSVTPRNLMLQATPK